MASDREEVVDYDPWRSVSSAGSDGKVTVDPNEDASTPRMPGINNFRLPANDMRKKFKGLPWGERWRSAKQMKKEAESIGKGKGDGRSRSRSQQSR